MSIGSNKQTMDRRKNSGIGAISEIFSLVNEESLGYFYFEILFALRHNSWCKASFQLRSVVWNVKR